MSGFEIGKARIGGKRPLLIAGPCVVEERGMLADTAGFLAETAREIGWPLLFKASYAKDNRLSADSFATLGREKALSILGEVAAEAGLPCITDVHLPEEAAPAAEVVDCLQVPAFLCRQSSLLWAVGATGLPVNLKKGQFLAPEDLAFSAEKVRRAGSENVMLTERGSSFGFRDLVVDFRSFTVMSEAGYPVIFDLTHSQQSPGGQGGASGGSRHFVLPLARAALALGIDGLFMECHPDPAKAMSDAATQLDFEQAGALLRDLERLYAAMEAGDALE